MKVMWHIGNRYNEVFLQVILIPRNSVREKMNNLLS
jgi:hypothetical protein